MNEQTIQEILREQKAFFSTGVTIPTAFRKEALRRLYNALTEHETELCTALKQDLGKSPQESYMCEVGLAKSEISYMLRHIDRYAAERRVRTPLAQYISRSFEMPSPYGQVLIMSPWNYPVLLTIEPLVDALAAGNTAVVKPSAYSPAVSDVLSRILTSCFPRKYAAVVTGGRAENTCLLEQDFDYIFFTGSKTVGHLVMEKASAHLTPVTLELGGKSPCIVDETANIKLAAKRIVFGKYLNCGQTCVAPDYVYCDEKIRDQLIEEMKKQIRRQYGREPLSNRDYGKIINKKHYDRILSLIDKNKIAAGGACEEASLRIEPTILNNVEWTDAVMQEEIFGPVLPVLTFRNVQEALAKLQSLECPLALYIFSSDPENIRMFKERISFGGGCINDTVIHLATSAMGFGGVGASGMGGYHGKRGFETFSHYKSIVDKKTIIDLPMRYQPIGKVKDQLIRMFVR